MILGTKNFCTISAQWYGRAWREVLSDEDGEEYEQNMLYLNCSFENFKGYQPSPLVTYNFTFYFFIFFEDK
jgi:hypothetical protein